MNSRERKIVQCVAPSILNSFDPVNLLPYLQVQLLISDDDVNRIQSKDDQRFRVADFLVVSQQKLPSLEILIDALKQCGYSEVAKRLKDADDAYPEIPAYESQHRRPAQEKTAAVVAQAEQIQPIKQVPQKPAHLTSLAKMFAEPTAGPLPTPPRASKPKPSGRVAALRKFFEEKTQGSPLDADLNFLLQNTEFTEQQIREWFREFIKVCPDGKIDKKQFAQFYSQIDPNAEVTEEFCNHVFRCFDLDASGFIDFKEFLIALNIRQSSNPDAKLKWVFRLYDIDGNGTIDLAEMTRIIESIFTMLGPNTDDDTTEGFDAGACAAAVFRNIDANQDGELTEEEFISACKLDEFLYSILTSASMI